MEKIKWLVVYLVRPVLSLWIIVNGIPPSIKAVGSVVKDCIKLLSK